MKWLVLLLLPGCTLNLSICGDVDNDDSRGFKSEYMECQASEKRKERAATAALVTD